jgi:hypothetical protein|tara:strand:+ start:308 stop:547 length:240 start_codon:yes stop_codon:yes gene_type:complete
VFLILVLLNSHQGYFGKKGIRVFHLQRNWQWAPTVNTDSLWGLLPDGMKTKAKKGQAPVIDVTKSVSTSFYLVYLSILF